MLMTPVRLLVLRIFNLTLGRLVFFNRMLRGALLKRLIHSQKDKHRYTASSRFFDPREMD
jgi:hypothetical protein